MSIHCMVMIRLCARIAHIVSQFKQNHKCMKSHPVVARTNSINLTLKDDVLVKKNVKYQTKLNTCICIIILSVLYCIFCVVKCNIYIGRVSVSYSSKSTSVSN